MTTSRSTGRPLAVAGMAMLTILAGCTGVTPTAGSSTFTEPEVHPGLSADVDIRNLALSPVHLTITELNTNGRGVVVDETYDDQVTIEVDDEDVFRENGTYRVTIRVDGTIRWNRTVRHFEGYDLRIENNGSVTVVSHAMA